MEARTRFCLALLMKRQQEWLFFYIAFKETWRGTLWVESTQCEARVRASLPYVNVNMLTVFSQQQFVSLLLQKCIHPHQHAPKVPLHHRLNSSWSTREDALQLQALSWQSLQALSLLAQWGANGAQSAPYSITSQPLVDAGFMVNSFN